MKVEFTVGEATSTLGDDAERHAVAIEQLGGSSLEQIDPIFASANALRVPRGNVSGECVFTATKSYATRGDMITAVKAAYSLLNSSGSLVLTESTSTITMAGAILRSVQVSPTGVRCAIRYTFGITTIT